MLPPSLSLATAGPLDGGAGTLELVGPGGPHAVAGAFFGAGLLCPRRGGAREARIPN